MLFRSPQPKQRWWTQVKETYVFARGQIRLLGLKLTALFLVTLGALVGLGFATGYPLQIGILALPSAMLLTSYRFGKMAEAAAYRSLEGTQGAAAAVVGNLRGNFSAVPGVGVDKQQNLVHRVVGRAGVILVGEGPRPGALLAEQRKAHQRVVPGVPVHEITVGQGGVALPQLHKSLRKLPRALRPAEVTELRRRLDAMPRTALPIPKGPLPQGRKIPRR